MSKMIFLLLFSAKVSPVKVGWRVEAQEGDGEGEVAGVGRRGCVAKKETTSAGRPHRSSMDRRVGERGAIEKVLDGVI